MLCHECSKGWVERFIDRFGFLDAFLTGSLLMLFGLFCVASFLEPDYTNKDISRAMYALEQYATSYESLRSTDRFLMSQIDVVDVNDGKDVAISFYNDDRGKISTVYFHVNPDLSYRHIEGKQTGFFSSQGS